MRYRNWLGSDQVAFPVGTAAWGNSHPSGDRVWFIGGAQAAVDYDGTVLAYDCELF